MPEFLFPFACAIWPVLFFWRDLEKVFPPPVEGGIQPKGHRKPDKGTSAHVLAARTRSAHNGIMY